LPNPEVRPLTPAVKLGFAFGVKAFKLWLLRAKFGLVP
jgi:hypothetical protein